MPEVNKFQFTTAYSWGPGVTQRKHVAEMFAKQPVMINDIVVRAFTANNGYQFSTLLKNFTKTREFVSDDEYTWKLIGSTYKNIPLKEARDSAGTVITASHADGIGRAGDLIQLVFTEKYFADGEVIVGSFNEFYQFRIITEPVMEGSDCVYTVELMAGTEEGCPSKLLLPGEPFSWEFSPVENELSRKAGGIRKSTVTTMSNEWTTIRKYHKFTGAADKQQRLDVNIPMIRTTADGKKEQTMVSSWFDNESWIFATEWEREKERALFYSRSNRNSNGSYLNHGKSGLVIKEGDGIYAQMMYGNTHYYNSFNDQFSLTGLENAIFNIFEEGQIPLNERTVVIATGSRGMIQVNKAIMKETSGWNLVQDNSSLGLINKVSNPVNQVSLGAGGQYTQWRGPNGLVLNFILEPSLDDRERNKIMGPNNQGVLSSYSMYIYDFGNSAEPNMYLCKPKGQQDTFKYRIGMRNPFGINNGNVINYDEDSSEIHTMATIGACILDPTRCLAYLPSGLIA